MFLAIHLAASGLFSLLIKCEVVALLLSTARRQVILYIVVC